MACIAVGEIGKKACEVLDLSSTRARSLTLKFEPGELITATVEYMPDEGQLSDVLDLVKEYRLVEKDKESQAELLLKHVEAGRLHFDYMRQHSRRPGMARRLWNWIKGE